MTTAPRKLITAEEFSRMPDPPDGSQQELMRGVIITMPSPGFRHGLCCSKVARRLGGYVEANGLGSVCCNYTGFIIERDPDTVRGPDLSFWSKERLTTVPVGYPEVPPDLVVEVVSPSDHFSRIQTKLRHYLETGVRMVWIADPDDRTIAVYRADRSVRVLGEQDTLTGEEVVPGFSCRVAELFS
jgi:Uma2 family endonuclease